MATGASSSNETPSEDYDEAVESENDSEEPAAETRDDDLETIQEDGTNLVRDRCWQHNFYQRCGRLYWRDLDP